jgi:hypothetical protein
MSWLKEKDPVVVGLDPKTGEQILSKLQNNNGKK